MNESTAPQTIDQIMPIMYRRGFLLTEGPVHFRPVSEWPVISLGPYALATHPDASVVTAEHGGFRCVLIGIAYSARLGLFSSEAVLDALLEHEPLSPAFHQLLDEMSGRFIIVVWDGASVRVLQDAMGTRGVWYTDDPQRLCFGSHAELCAVAVDAPANPIYDTWFNLPGAQRARVTYPPGLMTRYAGITQVTPNTMLSWPGPLVTRFWPVRPPTPGREPADATNRLVEELRGLGTYLERNGIRPIIGVTAGSDSRPLVAAFHHLDPFLFTFTRNAPARAMKSRDMRFATAMAQKLGLEHTICPLGRQAPKTPEMEAERMAIEHLTGGRPSGPSPLTRWIASTVDQTRPSLLLTGIGGEVCRGFYRKGSAAQFAPKPLKLAETYGIASGNSGVREQFAEFIQRTEFTRERLPGYDLRDIFYWEHRMGIWQSSKLGNADFGVPALASYNSRGLFDAFFGQPEEVRHSGAAFRDAVRVLNPDLAAFAETLS